MPEYEKTIPQYITQIIRSLHYTKIPSSGKKSPVNKDYLFHHAQYPLQL